MNKYTTLGKQPLGINDVAKVNFKNEEKPEQPSNNETFQEKEQAKTIVTVETIFNNAETMEKPNKKVPLTIYIDETIAKKYKAYCKRLGKGSQSQIINDFLKTKFM